MKDAHATVWETSGKVPVITLISVMALIIGLVALAVAVTIKPAGLAPMTRNLQVEIYHKDSYARSAGVAAGLPEETNVATSYVWRPSGLYAFKGDTVVLTVINNSGSRIHSLVMDAFGVDTGPIENKGSRTVTFVADRVGTFKFGCGIPHDNTVTPINCSPDHTYQYDYFVVLER